MVWQMRHGLASADSYPRYRTDVDNRRHSNNNAASVFPHLSCDWDAGSVGNGHHGLSQVPGIVEPQSAKFNRRRDC